MALSLFRLNVCLLFLFFLFAYQLLIPNGDEPDYNDRVEWLQDLTGTNYNPVKLVAGLVDIGAAVCQTYQDRSALWSKLDTGCISQNTALIGGKFLLALLPATIIFIFFVGRKISIPSPNLGKYEVLESKKDALALSLLIPSVIYFSSLQSEEVLAGALMILTIHLIRKIYAVSLLGVVVYNIDDGMGYILMSFHLIFWLIYVLSKFFSSKQTLLIAITSIFVIKMADLALPLMTLLANTTNEDKFLLLQGQGGLLYELKHGQIFYWIAFAASGIFMTANGLKSYPAYIVAFVLILLIFINEKKHLYKFHDLPNLLIASIVLISGIILTLPNYAYAKYYYFLAPIIVYYLLSHFGRFRLLGFLLIMNLGTILNLGFYYI
jgi:hypothetical protein